METNVILKYRRETDCWACQNCDSENSMSFGKCAVCGLERNPSVHILKAWSPEQERMEKMAAFRSPTGNPAYRTDYPKPTYSSTSYGSGSSGDSDVKYLWIIIAAVLILAFIIAIVANA